MRLTLKVPSALKSQFPSPPLFGHLIVFHRELQRFRGFRQGSSWWTQSLVITLPNKGTLQQCQNYRTINLISLSSKVMLKIILSRLKPQAEKNIAEEQLPQNTTHLIQRPCYHRGSPCQDPAGNRTTRRPPDHCKETQTAVVWSCFPFIRSGKNHFARHSEMGKKTMQTEEEVGRQHQGMDRPGGRQVSEGSGEQRKWRKLVAKSSVVPLRPLPLRDR